MKYKFVKIESLRGNPNGRWYFVPQSVRQIIEHSEKIFKPHIQCGYNKASKKVTDAVWKHGNVDYHEHFNDETECGIVAVTQACGYELSPITMFEVANNLFLEAVQNRILNFTDGNTIYLANGVQQFGYNSDYSKIVEEIEKDELVYPEITALNPADARYIQWTGGKHWYAKIGVYDVIDAQGNQKWNTKEEAERAVKWYCEN